MSCRHTISFASRSESNITACPPLHDHPPPLPSFPSLRFTSSPPFLFLFSLSLVSPRSLGIVGCLSLVVDKEVTRILFLGGVQSVYRTDPRVVQLAPHVRGPPTTPHVRKYHGDHGQRATPLPVQPLFLQPRNTPTRRTAPAWISVDQGKVGTVVAAPQTQNMHVHAEWLITWFPKHVAHRFPASRVVAACNRRMPSLHRLTTPLRKPRTLHYTPQMNHSQHGKRGRHLAAPIPARCGHAGYQRCGVEDGNHPALQSRHHTGTHLHMF